MVITLGIGLATSAPDTPQAPSKQGRHQTVFETPGRPPDRGFCFFRPEKATRTEDTTMYSYRNDYRTYRYDWRFSRFTAAAPTPIDRTLR